MKIIATTIVFTAAGILLVIPFIAIALFVGNFAVKMAHASQNDLLLIAIALSGAVISMINGLSKKESFLRSSLLVSKGH